MLRQFKSIFKKICGPITLLVLIAPPLFSYPSGPEDDPGKISGFIDFSGNCSELSKSFSLCINCKRSAIFLNSFSSLSSPAKNWPRALIELSVLMTYASVRYWLTHKERLEGVHKYRFTWKDQSRRIFNIKNWHFDANCFDLNWPHYIAGALYYNIARANSLGKNDAFLLTLASSSFWEFFIEHRSDISLNDQIITPLGGLVLGEVWYQLGNFLSNRTGLAYSILGFLNPIVKLNRWMDGGRQGSENDSAEPGWYDLSVVMGNRYEQPDSQGAGPNFLFAGFHSQIIHPREFGRPGRIGGYYRNPVFSEVKLALSFGKKGIEEIDIFSRLVFFAYMRQEIAENHRGYSYYLGLGSGFTLFRKRMTGTMDSCDIKPQKGRDIDLEAPRDFSDKFSIFHLIGPVFDWTFSSNQFRLRMILDGYLDFALVNATAFSKYSEDHDIRATKTTLLYYNYYYGLGTTLSSTLVFSFKNIILEGSARYHLFDSIEGADAHQEEVADDLHLRDYRVIYQVKMGYRFPPTPLEIEVSYEGIVRGGVIESVRSQISDRRFFIGLRLRF